MPTGADPIVGKVALLTGATSAVGSATARLLQDRGARLAVAVERPWQVPMVAEPLRADGLLVGCVPPGDAEAAAGFVKGAADALGPIDLLLCADGAVGSHAVGREPAAELSGLLQSNLVGPATMVRAVVGPMKRRRSGSMVFVVTAAEDCTGANFRASMAGRLEYVRALAVELATAGIRVAAVLAAPADFGEPTAERAAAVAAGAVAGALGLLPGPGPLYPLAPVR